RAVERRDVPQCPDDLSYGDRIDVPLLDKGLNRVQDIARVRMPDRAEKVVQDQPVPAGRRLVAGGARTGDANDAGDFAAFPAPEAGSRPFRYPVPESGRARGAHRGLAARAVREARHPGILFTELADPVYAH